MCRLRLRGRHETDDAQPWQIAGHGLTGWIVLAQHTVRRDAKPPGADARFPAVRGDAGDDVATIRSVAAGRVGIRPHEIAEPRGRRAVGIGTRRRCRGGCDGDERQSRGEGQTRSRGSAADSMTGRWLIDGHRTGLCRCVWRWRQPMQDFDACQCRRRVSIVRAPPHRTTSRRSLRSTMVTNICNSVSTARCRAGDAAAAVRADG
jgi:hypothetical protein